AHAWISPYFYPLARNAEGHALGGYIWVLNPNPLPAKVIVTMRDVWNGEKVLSGGPYGGEVLPLQAEYWSTEEIPGPFWVHLESDRPVLVAGYCPVWDNQPYYVAMTFY